MKFGKLTLAMALAALWLGGCGKQGAPKAAEFTPQESCLYLTEDGGLISASVEPYEAGYYTAEELEAYVKDALLAFNGADGAGEEAQAAQFYSCVFDETNKTASLLIDFKDADTFLRFQEAYPEGEDRLSVERLELLSAAEAKEKGYLDGAFVTADGQKKAVPAGDLTKKSSYHAAVIQGNGKIETEGTLLYVSEGVTVTGENQAEIMGDQMVCLIYK